MRLRTPNQRAGQRDDLSDADHIDAKGSRAQPPILCGDRLAGLHLGPTHAHAPAESERSLLLFAPAAIGLVSGRPATLSLPA